MSLIADALKAAQREKAKRTASAESEAQPAFFALKKPPRQGRRLALRLKETAPLIAAGVVVIALGWALNAILRSAPKEAKQSLLVDTAALIPPAPDTSSYIMEEIDPLDESGTELAAEPPPDRFRQPAPPLAVAPDRNADLGDADQYPQSTPARVRPPDPGAATRGLRIEVQQPRMVGSNPLVAQALAAYNRGDYAAARDYYERALASGVASPEIYNNLGSVYRNLNDLGRAEQAYQSAIALNPGSASAWSNLGVVLYTLARKREATAAYQEALRLDPANASTKVNLAILFIESAVYPEAGKLLEEALISNPALSEAHYAYAQLREGMKDPAGAIQHYELFLATSAGRFPDLENRVRARLNRLRTPR